MHVKPQRSCKATVKSTEYARAGNHEAVISRPMTLLLWEREPVDVLCIWRLSENNFAASQESPGPHISLHVTPLMQRLCSIRKEVGKLAKPVVRIQTVEANMHVKPQKSCKATVKSTEYARAGNHGAVISQPMTLLLWEREPVDVLYIRRLSENNFACGSVSR